MITFEFRLRVSVSKTQSFTRKTLQFPALSLEARSVFVNLLAGSFLALALAKSDQADMASVAVAILKLLMQ